MIARPRRLLRRIRPSESSASDARALESAHLHVGKLAIRFDATLLLVLLSTWFVGGFRAGCMVMLSLASSVMLVELVRAALARRLGLSTSFVVTPLGGIVVGLPSNARRPVRVALAIAGPALHLTVAALLALLARRGNSPPLVWLSHIHLLLALTELLPVPPFDGGFALDTVARVEGAWRRFAIAVAGIAAFVMVATALLPKMWLLVPATLAFLSALADFNQRREEEQDARNGTARLLDAARVARERRDVDGALVAAEGALAGVRSALYREAAADELALALAAKGRGGAARRVLEADVPRDAREALTLSAIDFAEGDARSALQRLLGERIRGERRRESTRLLVDAYVALGARDEALSIAVADARLLDAHDLESLGEFARTVPNQTAAAVFDALARRRQRTCAA